MKDDSSNSKSRFDLRNAELETIGEAYQALNHYHVYLLRNQDMKDAQNFLSTARVLFYATKIYVDGKDEEIDKLQEKIKDRYSRTQDSRAVVSEKFIEDCEDIREAIDALRAEAGLSLPGEHELNPDNAALEGLD